MILKYSIAWIALVLIAILNGTIRTMGYQQFMTERAAHQLSTISGIILIGFFIWWLSRIWPLNNSNQAIVIGLIWLILTICFEFAFGHYVMRNSWSRLLYDYKFWEGRLWSLVLVWTLISPSVFYHFKRGKV